MRRENLIDSVGDTRGRRGACGGRVRPELRQITIVSDLSLFKYHRPSHFL